MNWNGKRVLVTGACGLIGSHLAERLVELGAEVRALAHYNALGSWGWLDQSPLRSHIEVVFGDVTDSATVREAMRGVDTVFHLAALIAIPYSYAAPSSYVQTNIVGTLHVLEAARQLETRRVVHTSTSEVYGTARYVPIDEEHPLQGQSPYSATKIGADKLVESFCRSFDSPIVTVRPFNTYGPRQSARAIVPTIISQCLTGDSVKLGSLTPTRDLNFVGDTVEGFVLAGSAANVIGRTINLGSGREISIGDLVDLIAGLVGRPVSVDCDDDRLRPRNSEVQRLVADNTRAQELLGWRPSIELTEGLQRTIDWIRDNLCRYRADVFSI